MGNSASDVCFPPIESADESGLLMIGGQLTTDWLLSAYRRGVFPWPVPELFDLIPWWSPDPRAVVELDGLHVSRRLRRRLRRGEFEMTCNRDFAGVIAACAEPRDDEGGTWITPEMIRAYTQLHILGHAHSVEAWHDGQLVGGVYGVAVGGVFAGESMFFRRRDASKAALAHLVAHLRQRGYRLLDVQQWTPHTGRLGAVEIPRRVYLARLRQAVELSVTLGNRLEPVAW